MNTDTTIAESKNLGGRPKGQKKLGGRVKGTPNKVTAEIKAMAAEYAPDALMELARLSVDADNEQTRVAACKEILDRAYGKAPQFIEQTNILTVEPTKLEVARRLAFALTSAVDNVTTH